MDFVQDPSSAHFSNDPIPKLVREVLQNSLDAREPGIRSPVTVEFVHTTVPADIVGAPQLAAHVRSCIQRAEKEELGTKVADVYGRALDALKADDISCLRVTDSGTTGLSGSKWDALVLQEGRVHKSTQAAGGSYGIGKNAVLNVSDVPAVIYSTRFVCPKKGRVEKMQGKATLMSHRSPGGNNGQQLQHIGFFQQADQEPLVTTDIPDFFRLPDVGTGVFVLGFRPSTNWVGDVCRAVLNNFFCAVHDKKLVVKVSSDSESDSTVINHETIDPLFDEMFRGLDRPDAYYYYRTVRDKERTRTDKLPKLGALDVYVSMEAKPRRTAYVNRNGMLISASRETTVNPIAPRGKSLWPDYAAVVIPATDRGDAWVREMEPPSHDSVSPGELPDESAKSAAEETFRRARAQVRRIIDKMAQIDRFGDTSNLTELATLFPDELDPTREGNRKLEVRRVVRHRDTAGDQPELGLDPEVPHERSGTDPGPGPNPDTPDPNPGPKPGPSRRLRKKSVRFVPVGTREAVVGFTPVNASSEPVTLRLRRAGGERDTVLPIEIVSATVVDQPEIQVTIKDGAASFVAETDDRVLVQVTTTEPIGDFAVRVY